MFSYFRNLAIYKLTRDNVISIEQLTECLNTNAFVACSSQDKISVGWVPPVSDVSDALFYEVSGHFLLAVQREEKILPSAVIKKALGDRMTKIETEQQRRLKKTERESIKDEVIHVLLPRAFSRYSTTQIWINFQDNIIVVDTSSARKAEDALALLRKSIGSLPVVPLTLATPPEVTITEWVRSGNPPAGFSLLDEAELKDTLEDGGVLRCKKQELVCNEIHHHIEAGKRVTVVGLDWQERIQFKLRDDASFRSLKYSDSLLEQNDDIDREDAAARFDADFFLMRSEVSALINNTVTALGGVVKS